MISSYFLKRETSVGLWNEAYLEGAGWLTTTTGRLWCQVLPEEGVVDVATTVEVDQWLQSNLGLDITLLCGLLELLGGSVEAGDIGVVVLGMVKLHDLAGNGWLESAIVIYKLYQ